MKKLFIAISVLFLLATPSHAGLFGRTQPVYNVIDADITTASGKTPSLEQVQKAFIEAATYKRWKVKVVEPGRLVATISVRRHFAQVDVKLAPEEYSIIYNSSRELRYNGMEIHRNYNKWVKLLEQQFQLNMASY